MEHPHTILAAGNLAAVYCAGGRWHEACDLLEPVVQLSMKVFGKQHPQMEKITGIISLAYEKLGRSKEVQA